MLHTNNGVVLPSSECSSSLDDWLYWPDERLEKLIVAFGMKPPNEDEEEQDRHTRRKYKREERPNRGHQQTTQFLFAAL